jgi:hypothetical protein
MHTYDFGLLSLFRVSKTYRFNINQPVGENLYLGD